MIAPEDPEANRAVGRVELDGRWVTEEEAYRARGYVDFEGQWMTPAEQDAILRSREADRAKAQARSTDGRRTGEGSRRTGEGSRGTGERDRSAGPAVDSRDSSVLGYLGTGSAMPGPAIRSIETQTQHEGQRGGNHEQSFQERRAPALSSSGRPDSRGPSRRRRSTP